MPAAMIWGASGDIGRALVRQLSKQEWQVFALSRHVEGLRKWTDHCIEADPGDDYSVQQAVMQVGQQAHDIALWIYAAGDITSAKIAQMAPDDWRRIVDANLSGAYLTTHHSLPLLAQDAHLFYLGAYSEKLRFPGLAAYAAAKAGLEAFTTALAKEERKRKITNVRPAAVDTSLWEKTSLNLPKGALQPGDIAQRILDAHAEGQTGSLDL